MVSTTLGALVSANTPIGNSPSPLGALMSLRLPVAQAWARAEVAEAIESHLTRFEKMKREIVTRYGEPTAGGGAHVPHVLSTGEPNPRFVEAERELRELAAVEVSIDGEPTKIADVGAGELSALDVRALRACGLITK
jgi:hypothetical protein